MAKRTVSFKLVLLGNAAVGKSSTVERFVKNDFFEFQQPTIGAAFLTQSVQLDDHIVKFEIWDTAGQERYRSLAPMYYRGAAAALIVYDITNFDSFLGAKTWIEEIQRQCSSDIVIGLAGNKLDLEEKREVPTDEAQQFANDRKCLFYEMSAKSGDNVQKMFEHIAMRLPVAPAPSAANNNMDDFKISPMDEPPKKSGCC